MRFIAITILLSSVLGLLNAQAPTPAAATLAPPKLKTIAPPILGQKTAPQRTALVTGPKDEAGPYHDQSAMILPNGTKIIYQIYKSRGEHEDYLFDAESLAAIEAKLYEHYAWGKDGPPGGFTVDLAIHLRNPTVTRKRRNVKPKEKFLIVPKHKIAKFAALDKEVKDLMAEVQRNPVKKNKEKKAFHPRKVHNQKIQHNL